MGLLALPTAELRLEGVRVPAAARLGGDGGVELRALAGARARRPRRDRRRRGARELRGGARLRQGAPDLRRADRDAPGDRLQARRHGDRDRRRAPAGVGGGLAPRPRRGRAARGDARLRAGEARSRSRWPTAPCRCSAATATRASTCPSSTCETRGATRASKPWRWSEGSHAHLVREGGEHARGRALLPQGGGRADAPDLAEVRRPRARPAQRVDRLVLEEGPPGRRARRRRGRRLRAGLHPGRGALLGRRRALPAHADPGARRLRRRGGRHRRAEGALPVALPRRRATRSGARWRSPSRTPEATPPRSRRPRSSTATSGC